MAHFRNVCKVGHSPTADPESDPRGVTWFTSHDTSKSVCLNLSIPNPGENLLYVGLLDCSPQKKIPFGWDWFSSKGHNKSKIFLQWVKPWL